MAAAETARLIASLELQDKNFTRGIRNVERGIGRVDKKLGAFSGFVNRNMGRAIDSIAVRIVGSVGTGLEEMATLEDAASSVTGAIKQVGPSWTLTAADVVAAANRIESETDAAFDDKLIVGATETLIRYGKVSEKNLVPAMEVMTDLAARTGDVDSAATLLGKALADPAKAAGKLARQGIILTKEQQKQIKAMVKVGDTAGAQTLLLEILTETTKGAAAASAGPYRDALNKLGDAGEDLRRGLVTGLAPALIEVSDLLTTELAKQSTIDALKGVGKDIGGALKGIIGVAKSLPWATIGQSLKLAGTGAKAILDAFLGLPTWVQTAVLTGWGLNKLTGGLIGDLASGLIKGVLGMNAGVVNINAGVVNGAGGLPGGKGGGRFGGAGKLLLGLTGVGLAAAIASEFEDEIQGLAGDLHEAVFGWLPKISPSELEWPFGPKNTPKILPEIFGGNGLLGGTSAVQKPPTARTTPQGGANAAANAASIAGREAGNAAGVAISTKLVPTTKAVATAVGQVKMAVTAQGQANKAQIANASSIATRENSAQRAELGNIKNATITQSQQAQAQAVAQIAVTNAQTAIQAFHAVTQRLATAAAGMTVATATRGVPPPIVGALGSGFAGLRATIWASGAANRSIVQSTNIVEKTTVVNRYGSTSDSRHRP